MPDAAVNPAVRSAAAGTPRERRRLATRRAIQLAALRLALDVGLENVTVQAISDAADIAPRTFFTYFTSKDQALTIDVPWGGERLRSMLLARPPGEPPLRALRAVLTKVAARLGDQWEETRLWRELVRRHPGLLRSDPGGEQAVITALTQALADRLGTDAATDTYPFVATTAAVAVARAAFCRWCEQPPGSAIRLESLFDEAFSVLEAGL